MIVRWLDVRWSTLFLGFTFFVFSGYALPLGGSKFFSLGLVGSFFAKEIIPSLPVRLVLNLRFRGKVHWTIWPLTIGPLVRDLIRRNNSTSILKGHEATKHTQMTVTC
jgi:hypothetical protein